jgi:hypothetical protein
MLTIRDGQLNGVKLALMIAREIRLKNKVGRLQKL